MPPPSAEVIPMLKAVFSSFLTVVLAATAAGTPVRHKSTHPVETSNATGSFVREHKSFLRNKIRFVWARCVASSR